MTTIRILPFNHVHLRVIIDDAAVERELYEYFSFEVPGAKFQPAVRARMWDGFIHLFNLRNKTLYVGLLPHLLHFAELYECTVINNVEPPEPIEFETVKQFAQSLEVAKSGQLLDVYDYQLESIHKVLAADRQLLVSPTSSGKSLIAYIISRWHISHDQKVLLITSSTNLVEQMYSDFVDYSTINHWPVDDLVQKLYFGFSRTVDKSMMITTWQSITKQDAEWFAQFDVVIGDECHLFQAKATSAILEKMTNTRYRLGMTGTLNGSKTHQLVLEGLFGQHAEVTTTRDLIDNGQVANLKITALILKYPDEIRKANAKMPFPDEKKWLIQSDKRNHFITKLALSRTGNTLVLFQIVAHGRQLFEQIHAAAGGRPVHYIDGNVPALKREAIRAVLQEQDNAIVVASYGTLSQGANIPSIENVIFGSPSKSRIRNLQSIGRGLRLSPGKSHCNLFDLTDDLQWKTWKNHTLRHGNQRYTLYIEQQFEMQLVEVRL